jgi:hypothetical protein
MQTTLTLIDSDFREKVIQLLDTDPRLVSKHTTRQSVRPAGLRSLAQRTHHYKDTGRRICRQAAGGRHPTP